MSGDGKEWEATDILQAVVTLDFPWVKSRDVTKYFWFISGPVQHNFVHAVCGSFRFHANHSHIPVHIPLSNPLVSFFKKGRDGVCSTAPVISL